MNDDFVLSLRISLTFEGRLALSRQQPLEVAQHARPLKRAFCAKYRFPLSCDLQAMIGPLLARGSRFNIALKSVAHVQKMTLVLQPTVLQ